MANANPTAGTDALHALADALDALVRARKATTQGLADDHCCNAIREVKHAITMVRLQPPVSHSTPEPVGHEWVPGERISDLSGHPRTRAIAKDFHLGRTGHRTALDALVALGMERTVALKMLDD